jgi:hypothetical protein
MQADNANGSTEIAGWIYVLGSGAEYVQGNAAMKTFWTAVAESIPAIGPIIQNFDSGGIVNINSSQGSQITDYVNGHNGKTGTCFTGSLQA